MRLKLILILLCLLSFCKTEVKVQIERKHIPDTIKARMIIPLPPVMIKEIHDTVYIYIDNTTIIQKKTLIDSVESFHLSEPNVNTYTDQIKTYRNRISNLEFLLSKSKFTGKQVPMLQKKLDSTTKEIEKTRKIIYDWPAYIGLILLIPITALLIYRILLKGKLRRKQRNAGTR